MKKAIITIILLVSFITAAQAQPNAVGRGIQDGAAVPGQAAQTVGRGIEEAGTRLQPNTGSATGDAVAGAPGRLVGLGGTGVRKAGELLQGATDSVTGAPKSEEARANLAAPINCETANADIATLQAERSSTTDRIGQGVRSVLPVSAAIRLLGGTYREGASIATGHYNQDLQAKIDKIKADCNVG